MKRARKVPKVIAKFRQRIIRAERTRMCRKQQLFVEDYKVFLLRKSRLPLIPEDTDRVRSLFTSRLSVFLSVFIRHLQSSLTQRRRGHKTIVLKGFKDRQKQKQTFHTEVKESYPTDQAYPEK